jgi:diaminohydroxyphosphoribosylaminopyrimidine deaminase/5-amino-6-(5-phosphoribosylamino)uracil reductase
MAAGASPVLTDPDRQRLREALALAEQSIGLSDPNPRVGCIVGWPDGRIAGRGFTQQAGGPHAEVVALREAQAAGADLRGATAWVTLEPCSHHGRTPPCCDALVAAGIARVVAAIGDPNPQVAGAGLARLRAAGIEVAMGDDAIASAARELNIGFFSRMERGLPWVRVKIAASLDGRTALPNGTSQWITGEAARADGHAWRRRAGAILTGIGTVLADDPRLDVRVLPTLLQPLRVVVDSHWRTPLTARILAPPGNALIAGVSDDRRRRPALDAAGTQTITLPAIDGRVDMAALIRLLADREVNEIHVEAGAALNGSLLESGQIDEWLIYLAPIFLGPGREAVAISPLRLIADAKRLAFVECSAIGADLKIRLRPVSESLTTSPSLT